MCRERDHCVRQATGIVTLVQEQRFQLATDDFRALDFVLTHKAGLEGGELQALCDSGTRVAVDYEDPDDLITHIAHKVVVAPS